MVVILGWTLMLLALASQLRADGYDHFNYEHGNTIVDTSPWNHDMDSQQVDRLTSTAASSGAALFFAITRNNMGAKSLRGNY